MMRASGLGPLPELLEEGAGWRALEKSFAAEKIPVAIVENRKLFLPLESSIGLFERAARAAGDRLFGVRVGEAMPITDYGIWLEHCACAGSLRQALQRIASTVHFQQPGSRAAVEVEGAFAIFRYYPAIRSETSIQHSDHILFPMMRFVENYAGAGWRPNWIELNYRRDEGAGELEELLATPIRYERPCVGVAFERRYLGRQNLDGEQVRQVTYAEVEASYTTSSYAEPLQSILAIVTLRLLDGRTDIDGAARMAGLGVQTLQRMLRQSGYSYRQVVDIGRSSRARALLRETDMPVTDIALDLGYTDHANFTRAFSRWLGCSPSDFRNRAAHETSALSLMMAR